MQSIHINEKYPDEIFVMFSNSPDLDINDNSYYFKPLIYLDLIGNNEYMYIANFPNNSTFSYEREKGLKCSNPTIDPPFHKNQFEIFGDNNSLYYVKKDPRFLKYVKYKTKDICSIAVQENGKMLKYIDEKTPDYLQLCFTAVQNDGSALKYVKEQTFELCLAAVQNDGSALKYVKEQTFELCLAAVQNYPHALYHVEEQIPDYLQICLAAIQRDKDTIIYVKGDTRQQLWGIKND